MFKTNILQTPVFIAIALAAAVLLLILLFILIILSVNKSNKEKSFPFYVKKPSTPAEQALYFLLVDSFPVDYVILFYIALSKFLDVKAGVNYKKNLKEISKMTVDFLVCKKDFSVVAAFDLDKPFLKDKSNREAYNKKIRVLQAADISIIKWNNENTLDAKKIKENVNEKDLEKFPSEKVV